MLLCGTLTWCQESRKAVSVAEKLNAYMERYPESQLRDVYKTCFQDYFGPGHIIRNEQACIDYLKEEISSTKVFGGPAYEPCGVEGNYYRVNISLVANDVIPMELYVRALVKSATVQKTITVADWRAKWKEFDSIIRTELETLPNNYEEDALFIYEILAQERVAVHHSSRYNQAYNFHYRIIRMDIFEKDILPILKRYGY